MQPLSPPSRTAPSLSRRQWLATTLTLLIAIAALPIIGLSKKPKAG